MSIYRLNRCHELVSDDDDVCKCVSNNKYVTTTESEMNHRRDKGKSE